MNTETKSCAAMQEQQVAVDSNVWDLSKEISQNMVRNCTSFLFVVSPTPLQMLKRHFEHEDYYVQLVELFHDVTYRTEMGQLLDLTSQPMDGPSDPTR